MPKVYLTNEQRNNERIKNNLIILQGRMSCSQMGKIMGVSKSTYLNRLKSPQKMTLKELDRICKHFDVSVANFLTGELSFK